MSMNAKLRKLAALLPPKIKVRNGVPVAVGTALQLENHEKNLMAAWNNGGRTAVEVYVEQNKAKK